MELVERRGVVAVHGPRDIFVNGVTIYPESAAEGTMFLSFPDPAKLAKGITGEDDVELAARRGARVFVSDRPPPVALPGESTWIRVDGIASQVEKAYASWYGKPSHHLHLAAITGTKGKTTSACLLHHILGDQGVATGLVCSSFWCADRERKPLETAALPPGRLQEMLAQMKSEGCAAAVVEVVSWALATDRLSSTRVRTAGFTNLGRDHINLHGDTRAYAQAKRRLFSEYAESACFNVDDTFGRALSDEFTGSKISVGVETNSAMLRATILRDSLEGTVAVVEGLGGTHEMSLPLPGRYNVPNALVAIGMAYLMGVPVKRSVESLADAPRLPGRLQRVPGPRAVYVDFAHTEESLATVLACLRPHFDGTLICVFGAGGDTDRGKRPLMGAAAARHADLLVITSDNPRGEAPEAIIEEIVAGIGADAARIVEPDRRLAIRAAVERLELGGVLLIAGKGDESLQTIGSERIPFSDVDEASHALRLRFGADPARREP